MRVASIDHVQLAMPQGREAEARAFYSGILGIPEVEKPLNLAKRGGCWFECGPVRIHLGVEKDFRAAKKAHPALLVEDLPALIALLRNAGHACRTDEPLEGYNRIYVDDPFGNRIELMEPGTSVRPAATSAGMSAGAASRSACATFLTVALLASAAFAQSNPAALAARQWRQTHERAIIDEFVSLLSIPNIGRDHDNIRRNAETIAAMMTRRGVAAKIVAMEGANPVVFGEIATPGATRTLLFYAHYDGQPLDPREWATPPFEPVLRDKPLQDGGKVIPLPAAGQPFDPEWRLYARGSGDDKAPIIAMMAALDGVRAAGLKLRSNIKFAFEGEEEAGSPNLERILDANKQLFAADMWLMCDGPVYQTRQQQIVFGARGDMGMDITLYGPRNELHSGHYGNWAPNPAMMLAQLLASMKDAHGRVLIDHFYDGIAPLTPLERRAIAEAPAIDDQLMREFWLGSTEGAPARLNELVTQPALNVRGMGSSRIGAQASNVIPATATASLDIRLVPGMDWRQTADRITEHIRKQGYFIVDKEPDADTRRSHPKVALVTIRSGDNAVRTPMDLPIAQEVIRVVESARGPVIKLPNMGGSLPLTSIVRPLGTRVIVVPIANHDDNQHSFNENLRLRNLWDGIELMAALLQM